MTGPSTRDSRLASTAQRSSSGEDSSGSSGLLAVGSLGAVLLSGAISSIAYGVLPEQMRIHWTLGMGPYYGPEFAPSIVVLTVFPVIVATTALATYFGGVQLSHSDEFATIQPYYLVAVLGTLVALLGFQAAIIIANM